MLFSLERLKQEHDVQVHWRAFELRPAGSPPIPPEYAARIAQSRPAFAAAMKSDHGVDIVFGPFGIDSRPSLILDKYAEAHGAGDAFHMAVLEAYWRRGEDISDSAVLTRIAASVGLPTDALQAALADVQYAAQVDGDIAQARAFGLSGVPATVFDRKYLVSGAQPYAYFVSAVHKAAQG